MKKLIILIAVGFAYSVLPAAQAVVLVKDGKPVAKIYVTGPIAAEEPAPDPNAKKKVRKKALSPDEAAAETRAQIVRDLNYHFKKMSGIELEVVASVDPASVKGPAIVIGEVALKLGAAPASKGAEAFRLLTKGDLLLIGSTTDNGARNGVYEVLAKLGCEWVMPGEIGEIIPQRKTIELNGLDESQAPDFQLRDLRYSGSVGTNTPEEIARFGLWKRRQKMSSEPGIGNLGAGHAWTAFISKHKAEIEADPTLLALRRMPDGTLKRSGPQLESTHPKLIETYVNEIKAKFAQDNLPKDANMAFGIGPADGLGYSESFESKLAGSGKIDPISGDPDVTDLIILLGNQILEKLGPEYPNVRLGFYLYSVHGAFPSRYKPHPRINVIFAPISYSRVHGFDDENSKTRAYYKNITEQWGALAREQGNLLSFRGYNWNLAEGFVPFTQVRMNGSDIPFYKKNGFVGSTVEAFNGWPVNGAGNFVYFKLLWNSSQDWKKLLHHYCEKSFGAGAPAMERYYHRLVDTQHGAGQEAGSYHAIHLIFNDAFVAASEADIKEAHAAAQTEQDKTRIEYIGTAVEALKLYLAYHKATMDFDFVKVQAGYDAMQAHCEKILAINGDLTSRTVPKYLKRFLALFVSEGLKYSSGSYRMIHKLPDELPTVFDPNSVGEQLRLQDAAINDSGFIKTRTYSTTWDAQGLAFYRSSVWYRHRFTLPADMKGKPVGLFLGGFDDEARVYCNGKIIGTSGRGFSKPAVFDLTDDLKPEGGENLISIQIYRNSAANELGVGGLLRPSYLFTGPRLETKAPKPFEQRRVLPGGELGEVENEPKPGTGDVK